MLKTHLSESPVLKDWQFEYISLPAKDVCRFLGTSFNGLSEREARHRLKKYGFNEPAGKKKDFFFYELIMRFKSPLTLLLFFVAIFSFFFADKLSAIIIFLMILMSVTLSFFQEQKAEKVAEKLSKLVRSTSLALREGKERKIPIREIVPGDIVSLSAGDIIPADLRLIKSNNLYINQASLTGESMPAEKSEKPLRAGTKETAAAANLLFMGTAVVSGSALAVAIHTGASTDFGQLTKKLNEKSGETLFDKEIKDFTVLMIKIILIIVAVLISIYTWRGHDFFNTLLYSLAIAVQITPETLPMIVTINLSRGAVALSKKKVIIKHLYSIQNLGAMDILCTDKTGTLTMDKVILEHHYDIWGQEDEKVLEYGFLNSYYQTGLKNLIDKSILEHEYITLNEKSLTRHYEKVDEVPFDFTRKIMSVIVKKQGGEMLIAKGAPEEILARCAYADDKDRIIGLKEDILKKIKSEYDDLSLQGFRVLAVAYKNIDKPKSNYTHEEEKDLVLMGYMAFFDPPKPSVKETVKALKKSGISLKILTGDNPYVAKKICEEIGLRVKGIITGDEIDSLSDRELASLALKTRIFARVLPLQKERIIRLLRSKGHTVGYLGDGINDAPSLKAADAGISVNNAADIAKESASIILLEKDLRAVAEGVMEGRRVFGNFLNYIRMTGTINLGYMFTALGASLVLPFLPMAPVQLLVNNYLYEVSQTGIPSDKVDHEYLKKPRSWSIGMIIKFMLSMAPVCTLFDFLTFGVLWFIFRAFTNPAVFQTGWFLESMCAEVLLIYVIRSRKIPFFRSRSSKIMAIISLIILSVVFILPFTGLAKGLGFVHMPLAYYPALALLIIGYLSAAWAIKNRLLKEYEVKPL